MQQHIHKKEKGAIAELVVASKFLKMGWKVLLPFGENHRYDLVAEKRGKFVRIQVKYVTPRNGTLEIGCKSSNNWSVLKYKKSQVDVIAAYDSATENIYFIPSSKFNSSSIKLRSVPTKNHQQRRIRHSSDFVNFKV